MAVAFADMEVGGVPRRPTSSRHRSVGLAPRRPNYIRDWRKYRGLTLEKLAELSGVGVSTISSIETRKHGYSWESLEALADALDCEPGDLLSRPPLLDQTINDLWTELSPEERQRAVKTIRLMTGKD